MKIVTGRKHRREEEVGRLVDGNGKQCCWSVINRERGENCILPIFHSSFVVYYYKYSLRLIFEKSFSRIVAFNLKIAVNSRVENDQVILRESCVLKISRVTPNSEVLKNRF